MMNEDINFSRKIKETVTLNIDQDFYLFLRALAEQQGIPLSVYIKNLTAKAVVSEMADVHTWKKFKSDAG